MQLWFMVVMAAVALILFGISLGIGLHRALSRPPYARERPPLIPMPLQPRSPRGIYPPSNAYLFDSVPDVSSSPNTVTLKAFTMHMEEVTDSKVAGNGDGVTESQIGVVTVSTVHMASHDITQNPLRRSVSQLIDRKVGEGHGAGHDDVWDPQFRAHDSGMFDEEFVDTIKGFSTVRKEHTMFTDTNL
ncbi:usherin [Neoarius graeffei]|uniref:usherin n=1 Tax=Neoarius graeffei TaxID=443677 RepID=UPI00298CC758|nr:usherin [Neoarius graeffei]